MIVSHAFNVMTTQVNLMVCRSLSFLFGYNDRFVIVRCCYACVTFFLTTITTINLDEILHLARLEPTTSWFRVLLFPIGQLRFVQVVRIL